MTPPIAIAPSILAADVGHLVDEVADAVSGGADWIHVDVMDGHFVPNLTFGPGVVQAVRGATDRVVDVHLMIEPVDVNIAAFAAAGADVITVHAEATKHLDRTLGAIAEAGVTPGVALNPATPVEAIHHVIDKVGLVLVMTVNPGFGGQRYIAAMEPKIAAVRQLIDDRPIRLQVDGGIDPSTGPGAAKAGANTFVAGSAVFGSADRGAAIAALRAAVVGAPAQVR